MESFKMCVLFTNLLLLDYVKSKNNQDHMFGDLIEKNDSLFLFHMLLHCTYVIDILNLGT